MPPVVPISFLTAETLHWAAEYLLDPHPATLRHIQGNFQDAAVLLDWVAENIDKYKPMQTYPMSGSLSYAWEMHLHASNKSHPYRNNNAHGCFLSARPAKLLKALEDYLPPVPTE